MNMLLIAPAWHRSIMKDHVQFPPLGLAAVAGATPPWAEVSILDENVEPVDFDFPADLVGLTAMTCQAPRAYEIAAEFRRRGVPTVMGGPHASLLPEEACRHVDSVVIGEAEEIWPEVVADAKAGTLAPVYRAKRLADLSKLPKPRRDLLRRSAYGIFNTVQTTRGCPFDCDFCSVTTMFARSYRSRPVEDVVAEIEGMAAGARRKRDRLFFLVDDNIVAAPPYAKQLFRALIPLKIQWFSQGTITTFAKDDELLRLARKSGCIALFIGLESISAGNLTSINKSFNRLSEYESSISRIHRHGIGVLGSFIYGLEHDTEGTFDDTVAWAQRNALEGANFSVLTPYPGTRLARRLAERGLINSTDWRDYHALSNRVVFTHGCLSEEQLLRGTAESWIRYYSVGSLAGRFLRSPRSFLRILPVLLAYRRRAVNLPRGESRIAPEPSALPVEEAVR
jgi:radical SAM superfamily enzyme YgiQ (UPF0313 family)